MSEFRSHFFSEVSHAIALKAEMTSRAHFNCKAVEVTEVIEEVNSKKSGRKNHRWRRRIKKHSRISPDVQFKEFSLTKQKTRPRTDDEWIGKTI